MDKRRLQAPIWDAKKKRYKRNKDGSLTMRDIPQTKLAKSKWMAYLHKDSESGIWHLHIIISRYNMDNELNCDDEIAKRAAQAAEELNKKYGYRSAEDIHDEHAAEIRQIIDDILDVTSTTEELGKPVGSDEENNKTTFVTVMGIEKAKEEADMLTGEAMALLENFDGSDFLKALTMELLDRRK